MHRFSYSNPGSLLKLLFNELPGTKGDYHFFPPCCLKIFDVIGFEYKTTMLLFPKGIKTSRIGWLVVWATFESWVAVDGTRMLLSDSFLNGRPPVFEYVCVKRD